jgi:predicted Holliday junction resolvase-like endonuclease
MDWTHVMAIVVPVLLAVILGIIYNNRRINDLRSDMNQRFVEMMQTMNNRFEDMNQRFTEMMQTTNNRFEDINQRFVDMNQRISDIKSDISEIRHLLIDQVRRDFDVQRAAEG